MSVTLPGAGTTVATETLNGEEVQVVKTTAQDETNMLLRAILDRLGYVDPSLGAQRTTIVNTPAVTLASTTITGTPAVSLASTVISGVTAIGGLQANADQYVQMALAHASIRDRITIS